ncbi:hypothetical protein [Saccharopolyspora phatthalungensis]|uniref:Uncharacterized protein n=1 Tax=Saccharopolyspora phatthalungensis TaxID=664693 RepID=A0A840QHJ4_9PSEU|nr:hypothetical protein [Saccharopolyspora phatthalungensis]MBB5159996.1 hypothetical protein [Saccharopolyspora phatthalungensis]
MKEQYVPLRVLMAPFRQPARVGRGRADGACRGRALAPIDGRVTPLLFIAPLFVSSVVFSLCTAWVSLHDWHLINSDRAYVALSRLASGYFLDVIIVFIVLARQIVNGIARVSVNG